MAHIIPMRGVREAPKADRSKMETLLLTPEIVAEWRLPPFQRPLRVNKKVLAIADELKDNGGFIEGVISLGFVGNNQTLYLYDGQHRIEAAKLSGLTEFIADVRICKFETLVEMGVEFVKLNTAIAKFSPDDVLRGLEASSSALRLIRKECPFVGYENIRRGTTSPTLSMSATMRCWIGAAAETPSITGAGKSAAEIAHELTVAEAEEICRFLKVARAAWGNDLQYSRLWGNLNLCMSMWLWRRLVLEKERGLKRFVVLSEDKFRKCLMSLSATSNYVDWLVGRNMSERDRTPCYQRLKSIFVGRLKDEGIANPKLPAPSWSIGR